MATTTQVRRRIWRMTVSGVLMAAGIVLSAGQASAAPLGNQEHPHTTFGGELCRYADVNQGYGTLNEAGERRVYQLAFREADDQGLRQGVLNVHVNDAGFLKRESGGWNKGQLLGQVTIGCGTT